MIRTETAKRPRADERSAPHSPSLTLGEVIVGGAVVVVALIGLVSLGLAQVGWHSLVAVVGVSVLLAGSVAVLGRRHFRVRVRVEGRELLVGVALVVGCAVLFLPGFPYTATDKDPGVYVAHGVAIAREGSLTIPDPVLEEGPLPGDRVSTGSRFPGLWVDPDDPTVVRLQFYHLWPSLLATSYRAFGIQGVFHLNAVLASLAVLATAATLRRAFDGTVALVGAALLMTNMLEVWHAKYPTTEVPTQLFVAGALLGLVLAIDERWAPAAGASGFLVGVSFAVRPDAVLLLLLAAGLGGVVLATRRWDVRAWWFAGGVAAALPIGLVQAYVLSDQYSRGSSLPSLPLLGAVTVGLFAAGALASRVLRSIAGHRLEAWALDPSERLLLVARVAIVGGFTAVLSLALLRPDILGQDTTVSRQDSIVRTFNEENLHRLSFFITYPGLVLALLGLVVVTFRRWRATAWVMLASGLLLTPLYLWDARVSRRLMWWSRRYVPFVLVVLIVLIAVALAAGLRYRGRFRWVTRIGATVAGLWLLGTFLSQSAPLRGHREYGGSYSYVSAIADLAGDERGLFLFEAPQAGHSFDPARTFAGAVWFHSGQPASFLPPDPTGADVLAYREAFPDRRIVLLTRLEQLPAGLMELPLAPLGPLTSVQPLWEETLLERPNEAIDLSFEFWAWTLESLSEPSSR